MVRFFPVRAAQKPKLPPLSERDAIQAARQLGRREVAQCVSFGLAQLFAAGIDDSTPHLKRILLGVWEEIQGYIKSREMRDAEMVEQQTGKTVSQEVRDRAIEIMRDPEMVRHRAELMAIQNSDWGKGMSDDGRRALAKVARDAGLSVALGHIVVLGGKPYITIDGQLYKAHQTGEFEGFTDEGPLPKDEWEYWGVHADALCAWRCTCTRGKIRHTEVGWAGGEREKAQPVARNFYGEMARKRARSRVLDVVFPIGYGPASEAGIAIPEEIMSAALEGLDAAAKSAAQKPAPVPAPAIKPASERLVDWPAWVKVLEDSGLDADEAALIAAEPPFNIPVIQQMTSKQASDLLKKMREIKAVEGGPKVPAETVGAGADREPGMEG